MLITYTCSGQKSGKCIFTLLACMNAEWCHRVLPQAVPRRPSATSEDLLPPLRAYCKVKIIWKWVKKYKILPSLSNSLAPWWPIKKADVSFCPAWPEDHFCQVSSKSVDVQSNFGGTNWRIQASPLQDKGCIVREVVASRPLLFLTPNTPQKGNHLASLGG